MRLRLALALAAATVPLAFVPAAAFAQEAPAASEGERLNAWFETKFEEQLQFSPLTLTALGRRDRYGDLDDFSVEGADWQLAWYKASVEELEREFDYDKLGPQDRQSYDLWKYDFESAARAAKWRGNAYVFNQMQGMHSYLPTLLITQHAVETPADMAAYISRVGQFERALGQLVDQAEANAARGVRPPYFAYDIVLDEANAASTATFVIDTSNVSAAQVIGSRHELHRVVRNLLDNARRHARTSVIVELDERAGDAWLVVSDDGPGIPLEDRERVLERFARLDESRSGGAGRSGLGLAIVDDIATRHGGTTVIDDAPGGGARVTVKLPSGRIPG